MRAHACAERGPCDEAAEAGHDLGRELADERRPGDRAREGAGATPGDQGDILRGPARVGGVVALRGGGRGEDQQEEGQRSHVTAGRAVPKVGRCDVCPHTHAPGYSSTRSATPGTARPSGPGSTAGVARTNSAVATDIAINPAPAPTRAGVISSGYASVNWSAP